MSYNFALTRLALFAVCVAVFYALGGFQPPEVSVDSLMDPARVSRAWMLCVILFLVGAGSVSLVDHYVGVMEPANLRPLYVVIGVLLMAGSFVWQRSLKQGTRSLGDTKWGCVEGATLTRRHADPLFPDSPDDLVAQTRPPRLRTPLRAVISLHG